MNHNGNVQTPQMVSLTRLVLILRETHVFQHFLIITVLGDLGEDAFPYNYTRTVIETRSHDNNRVVKIRNYIVILF